jgi:phosphotransferase system HPr (HPr) family protein
MRELEFILQHPSGLHLRPAALFVQAAAAFKSTVKVRNVTRDTIFQNAKSAIGVMMLKAAQGDIIHLQVEGEDEQDAFDQLHRLLENGFE